MVNPGPTAPPASVSPQAPPARRRRRWPWVLGGVVAVLIVLLVVADRVAASFAESAVEKRLAEQSPFDQGGKPHVSIHGFPFLTQAAAGRYGDIEVTGHAITVDQVGGITLDANMRGVHVPAGKAVSGHVTSLPIDRVDASVVIPYAEVARLTGIKGLALSDNDGALHVSLPVAVPGSPVSVPAEADAAVHVSGRRLSYAVGHITLAGVPAPAALTSSIAGQMNGVVTLPTLPYRLRVTGVAATGNGVRATARADHIVVDTS